MAEVVPEDDAESGRWRKLGTPDEIVEFYDPTDVFGDLADTLAEAFPSLGEPAGGEGAEAEGEEAERGEEPIEDVEPVEDQDPDDKGDGERR
jgi:hypothetical protein